MTAGLSDADLEAIAKANPALAALIARERTAARDQALDEAAKALLLMAAERMDEHGPHDARGAAIWDCGVYLRGQLARIPT